MKRSDIRYLTRAALIAALYVALTAVAALLDLASGTIQVRISEALCVLPLFTPAAIPGLAVGCLLANLLTGCVPWDIAVGSLATLLGALGTRALRERPFWVAALPPILANTILVPFVLRYAYGVPGAIPFFMLTVGIGEVLSVGVLGWLLYRALNRSGAQFWQN